MIQLTINLENEQLLNGTLDKMFESLSEETIQKIASEALFKYLTDSVDYGKQKFIDKTISKIRQEGIKFQTYSYDNKPVEFFENKSDNEILQMDSVQKLIRNYVSPKESQFDKINKLLETELKIKVNEFVNTNADLDKLLTKQKEIIKENFVELTTGVMQSLAYNVIIQTIDIAKFSPLNMDSLQKIHDKLSRNNIN